MDDQQELKDVLEYDSDLESVRQAMFKLMELINETQWGNSVDAMVLVDRYAESLQTARKANAALDEAMQKVDEWNKRFGSGKPEEADGAEGEDDTENTGETKKK